MPAYEAQIAARDRLLASFRGLRFVGVHLATLEWGVDRMARRSSPHPNARATSRPAWGSSSARRIRTTRKFASFFIGYQDRILYGSDSSRGDE